MGYKKHENSENEGNLEPKKYVHSWKNIWVYVQCYFVTIASILGTGVLGLPVTAWQSGFTPFLTSFLVDYVMQAFSILLFVDLLQKGQAFLLSTPEKDLEAVPLNELFSDDEENDSQPSGDDMRESLEGIKRKNMSRYEENSNIVNLHKLSELYMPFYLWMPFDATVFFVLIAVVISFSLAGSEAFAQLFGIENFIHVIPFFVWIQAFSIVIFGDIIKVAITFLTLFKGCILVAVVVATTGVGAEIDNPITNDFKHFGPSFLLGTVALGGVMNILPILYNKVEPVKEQVQCFFLAAFGGLTTCMILNVLWVLAVLHIVPQTDAECGGKYSELANENETSTSSHLVTSDNPSTYCPSYSLERSKDNGEISTVPLTSIILDYFPEYNWIGQFIQIFIAVSLTVSYLTFGSAMKHMLGGVLEAVLPPSSNSNEPTSTLQRVTQSRFFPPIVLLLIYVVIFGVCMKNPKGFVTVMEFFSSTFLNLEVGFFLIMMIQGSRKDKYRNVEVPWKLPEVTYYLQYVMSVFFLFAVVFAIIKAISTF
ncbi:uncharacterized protein LOC117121566 isoform X1 [Anneissia japonica]|uniref:uncharacterized protein LOC117121566 isoform X1 n=1 Tax=Anneissia japonica TaxID=1529436 RepID=UPI00142577FE|nr:uncharacterized protein LOC117121566 isoform X1 [Anneissia japonica]